MRYFRIAKMPRARRQAGDTIVEVLIVLAVLGLAFTLSYATATHALSQSRNAQEHSEALGVLNGQVELLRSALAKHVVLPINTTPPPGNSSLNFCMSDTSDPPAVVGFGTYTVPATAAADSAISNTAPPVYPASCVQGLYHVSIFYNSATGSYDLRVRWDGLGKLGRQQEEFNYKITPVAAAFASADYDASPALQTPTLQVLVRKIEKNSNNTAPSCSSSNPKTNLSSITATLSPGSQSGTTGSSGLTTITDLIDGQTYSATISSANYTFCNSTSATAKTIPPFNQITAVVASKCTTTVTTPPPYNHYSAPYAHYGPAYAHYSAPYAHYALGAFPGNPASYAATGGVRWRNWNGSAYFSPDYSFYYVLTQTSTTIPGGYGYSEYQLTSIWYYTGTWADYLGTWSDYLGTWADYWGYYSDPDISTTTCT